MKASDLIWFKDMTRKDNVFRTLEYPGLLMFPANPVAGIQISTFMVEGEPKLYYSLDSAIGALYD